MLRANAGQETKQDKERKQKEKNKERVKDKQAKEQALKDAFMKEREEAVKGFLDKLQDGELEYILIDFEASEIFKERVESWPMLFTLYHSPDGAGMEDRDIKKFFNSFIIDQNLDQTLNDFTKWQEKNADLK